MHYLFYSEESKITNIMTLNLLGRPTGSMVRKVISQFHILVLILYLVAISFIAATLHEPALDTSSSVIKISLIPIIGFFSILIYFIKRKNISTNVSFEKLKSFFDIYNSIVLLMMIVCLTSISYAIFSHTELLQESFSYSLRMISTTLHPLYPLESRLFHTLVPFALLASFGNKKVKFTLWSLYKVLAFLLQIKVAAIYLFFLLVIVSFQMTWKKNYLRYTFLGFSFVLCTLIYSFIYLESAKGFEAVSSNTSFQKEMVAHTPLVSINNPSFYKNCKDSDNPVIPQYLQRIEQTWPRGASAFFYRALTLPSIVSRLYVCAWDNGFHGYFKGHQIARLTGNYLPVYNILYRTYFPAHGNFSLANAVGNFAYDSYFQLGYLGVLLSTFVLVIILLLIEVIPSTQKFQGIKNLMKLNFLYGTLTASVLSAILFFVPLFACFLFMAFRKKEGFFLKKVNV